jgi:S-adenosylmethionine:tRNA-ribosyltransferase-isomerase (queuine synthetase)
MWKQEKWWQEIVDEVQLSRHNQVNTKLSKIVDKSLKMIDDRLTNGDFIFNNKTGTVERKEVSLKDATKVATDLLTRQAVLQKQEQEQTVQQTAGTIKDQLAMLAAEFARFNKRDNSKAETIAFVESTDDALHDERETGLQEGSSEVYLETSGEEEESFAEQSETDDGEPW